MDSQIKAILKSLKLNEDTISTILGAIVVVVIGLLVFNYFRSINPQGEITQQAAIEEATPGAVKLVENENGEVVPQGLPATYTVEKGDHLWSIAESYYNSGYNWVDIAQANHLDNPGQIEVGQKLTIPKVAVKEATINADDNTVATIDGSSYTVEKGDHLWDIAVRAYGDGFRWVDVYNANKDAIGSNPGLIETGMVLNLPR